MGPFSGCLVQYFGQQVKTGNAPYEPLALMLVGNLFPLPLFLFLVVWISFCFV